MNSADLKKALRDDWKWTRGLTYGFIQSVPSDKLHFSASSEFGAISKQLRHMGAVQECYIKGIQEGRIDFSRKNKNPSLEQSKESIVAYFRQLDADLKALLENFNEQDLDKVVEWIVWEDIPNPTIYQALIYMIQHEIFHQGILQLVASVAGFKTLRFF